MLYLHLHFRNIINREGSVKLMIYWSCLSFNSIIAACQLWYSHKYLKTSAHLLNARHCTLSSIFPLLYRLSVEAIRTLFPVTFCNVNPRMMKSCSDILSLEMFLLLIQSIGQCSITSLTITDCDVPHPLISCNSFPNTFCLVIWASWKKSLATPQSAI